MIIMLGVLPVTSSLLVAAFTAGIGEVRLTNTDVQRPSSAYYAAQAGISEYASHLAQDPQLPDVLHHADTGQPGTQPGIGRHHPPRQGSRHERRGIRDPR